MRHQPAILIPLPSLFHAKQHSVSTNLLAGIIRAHAQNAVFDDRELEELVARAVGLGMHVVDGGGLVGEDVGIGVFG